MLVISYVDASFTSWHLGEYRYFTGDLDRIKSIYADGDELDFVLTKFDNIPVCKRTRGITWIGDIAKFILANV